MIICVGKVPIRKKNDKKEIKMTRINFRKPTKSRLEERSR